MYVKRKFQEKSAANEQLEALQQQVAELSAQNSLLQEQLTRRDQLAAMTAHELRSPLAPIMNYAQMIARQVKNSSRKAIDQEAMLRHTEIIINQTRRLTRLVSDQQDASRISSGYFSLLPAECDLVSLSREMITYLRPLAPYHKFKLSAEQPSIVGLWDSARLQQVLGNLLDNAIKYSDVQTTITVRVWLSNNHAHISVHNEGSPIPSSEIGQLFHPYSRLTNAKKREGSGLGLFISKQIIEAHNGSLSLSPREESQRGSTFTFSLPLNPD